MLSWEQTSQARGMKVCRHWMSRVGDGGQTQGKDP